MRLVSPPHQAPAGKNRAHALGTARLHVLPLLRTERMVRRKLSAIDVPLFSRYLFIQVVGWSSPRRAASTKRHTRRTFFKQNLMLGFLLGKP
jgi:hypothetical protein